MSKTLAGLQMPKGERSSQRSGSCCHPGLKLTLVSKLLEVPLLVSSTALGHGVSAAAGVTGGHLHCLLLLLPRQKFTQTGGRGKLLLSSCLPVSYQDIP